MCPSPWGLGPSFMSYPLDKAYNAESESILEGKKGYANKMYQH